MQTANVVFWNRGNDNREATTVHLSGRNLKRWELRRREGLCLADFYKNLGLTFLQVREVFPNYVIPHVAHPLKIITMEEFFTSHLSQIRESADQAARTAQWGDPMDRLTLPLDREGLQQFSNLIKTPVRTFWHWDRTRQPPTPFHHGRIFQPQAV
jgi:hypothetical protein